MPHNDDCCSGCPLATPRREFLQDAARMMLAALVIRFETGRRKSGASEVSYPIPATDGASIDKQHQTILVRFEGVAYAFALSCPHQNTALRWEADDKRFQCPKHHSQYQPDGTFIRGRATRSMDRMPIRSDGKQLLVDVDHVFQSDQDASGWAAAHVKL